MGQIGTTRSWHWVGDAFESCNNVPIEDRGFRYGMAVFETLAVLGGRALFVKEHLASLETACRQCGFAFQKALPSKLPSLLEGLFNDGVVRIYVTADARTFVLAETRHPLESGTRYSLAPEPTPHLPFPLGLKTANYWRNFATVEAARRRGYDEALLVTPDGLVISGCMANVFVVHGGTLSTPSTSVGARPGVIRSWVLRHAAVSERDLRVAEMESADEIFLTNSWIGIVPVSAFRKPLPLPGPTTAGLIERFRTALTAP